MQPIDVNLASTPFRNNTLLWLGYGLGFTLLLGFGLWSVYTYRDRGEDRERRQLTLSNVETQLRALERRELDARRIRQRREYDLEALWVQANKANEVISWKAFSWTRLFNHLEDALPWNVHMTSIRPIFRPTGGERGSARLADGGDDRSIQISVEGFCKDLRALLDFTNRLFAHDQFEDPEPLSHVATDRGELAFTMRFTYYPAGQRGRSAASEADGEPPTEPAGEAGGVADAGETGVRPEAEVGVGADGLPADVAAGAPPEPAAAPGPVVRPSAPPYAAPGETASPPGQPQRRPPPRVPPRPADGRADGQPRPQGDGR